MKNKIVPIIIVLAVLAAAATAWLVTKKAQIPTSVGNNYTGSIYKGNYVWGGAMSLAWADLCNKILKQKLSLSSNNQVALALVDKFNHPVFTKKDLDEASYYIKSGYGQATVDMINKESKQKFPSKSFADLNLQLGPKDIIAYAYFFKQVKYRKPFEEWSFFWLNGNMTEVKGFYASSSDEKNNVKIIKYENDDKFIIRLELEDNRDQLILAKGYDMADPQNLVSAINKNNKTHLSSIAADDYFMAPLINLDYNREYKELTNILLANKNFEEYFIKVMLEKIKFKMDEKGARVESQGGVLEMWGDSLDSSTVKYKKFILDKPYWVVMKRAGSHNPYFILGVNNTELMETVR